MFRFTCRSCGHGQNKYRESCPKCGSFHSLLRKGGKRPAQLFGSSLTIVGRKIRHVLVLQDNPENVSMEYTFSEN